MYTILADCRYYQEIDNILGNQFHILPSYLHPKLQIPVAAHPDMTLFAAADNIFFCAPEAYCYYHRLLSPLGVKLVQGSTSLSGHYPGDIAYNIARVGKHLFGHPSGSDPAILRFAEKNGYIFHNTKQGYAKCSSCIVSEDALITADSSIFRSAQEAGLSVLKIREGSVLLPGYNHGFLGGASGLLPDGSLFFFGDITAHPDSQAIFRFCKQHGVTIRYAKNKPLTDIGTMFCIN